MNCCVQLHSIWEGERQMRMKNFMNETLFPIYTFGNMSKVFGVSVSGSPTKITDILQKPNAIVRRVQLKSVECGREFIFRREFFHVDWLFYIEWICFTVHSQSHTDHDDIAWAFSTLENSQTISM